MIVSALLAAAIQANSAIYIATNVIGGVAATDALFQNSNNTLLTGGIVSLGYFPTNAYVPSSNLALLSTTIADFIPVASGIAGTNSADLGGSFAGFVQGDPVQTASKITGADPLLGRSLYVFVGNALTLQTSTTWALKQVATITDDNPNERTYLANPLGGAAPVIGTIGSITGDAGGQGSGTFSTLHMVVPETSSVLLGALGMLGLLRRRR